MHAESAKDKNSVTSQPRISGGTFADTTYTVIYAFTTHRPVWCINKHIIDLKVDPLT